ncbi:MAG: hypothetical protein AAFY33_08690 [Cyanobacteria bacterium J06643_4]
MTPSKIFPIALLSAGLIVSTVSTPAEARRGSRARTGASSSVDLEYDFSIFDTTPTDAAIGCTAIANGCLFKDAISDLEITKLRSGDFNPNPIDRAEVGTSLLSLYGPETPPNSDGFGNLTDFPQIFPETLSLTAELLPAGPPPSGSPQSLARYTITDATGEPLRAKLSGMQDGAETEFPQDFSFLLYSDGNADTTLPNDGFINSVEFIVDFLRDETDVPSGYYFGREIDSRVAVISQKIDDDIAEQVPEPVSTLGLLAFGLLGVCCAKRKTA